MIHLSSIVDSLRLYAVSLLDIIYLPGNMIRTFVLDRRPLFTVMDEVLEARKVHITAWIIIISVFLIHKYDLWGELLKL